MVGARARAFAIITLSLGTGCGARHAASTRPAIATVEAQPAAEPVYRFVSLGVSHESEQQALDGGRIGLITDGWPGREIVNTDGSLELAAPGTSEHLMGAVPVPARLGGGFLFWNDALYRARSFIAPLEAIVELPTNAVGIEFGPDYALVLLPDAPPRAFALEPPHPLPLSPKGVIDVAASDDGRALALDATGRALASTNAGKSWKDVTSTLGAPVNGVREERTEVAFVVTRDTGAWLQPDGKFEQHPFASRSVERPPKAANALRRAVGGGLPLPGMRAFFGEGPGVSVVDLRTGSSSRVKLVEPERSSCVPLSVDEEALVACTSWTPEPTTALISHALGAAPVLEKTFAGSPQLLAGHTLTVIAGCSGAQPEGTVCVRGTGGVWNEVRASATLLRAWQALFWVPRENGGVAVIVSERNVPEPKLSLLDPQTNRVTLWDMTTEQLVPNGDSTRLGSSFSVLADGSVRGFTRNGPVAVDAKGHFSPSARSFASISSAGAHALARDTAEHLWQTSDYGAHWQEVLRPPFDEAPDAMAVKVNPRPSGRATRIDCSASGCVLEHPSGTGVWLRLGWPEDPPRATSSQSTNVRRVADEQDAPAAAAPPLAKPALPKLRCVSRTGGPLRVTHPPRRPPEPQPSGQWLDVLAGERALASRPPRTFANLAYRDVFSTDANSIGYGLRAAVHLYVGKAAQLSQLTAAPTPVNVLFIEPLDLDGRVRQLSASTGDWASAAERAGADDPTRRPMALDFQQFEGLARPLLSAEPGRAGGVLLIEEGLSLWAPNTGRIQPIPSGCSPVSGYVDARGTHFVACAERNGSTHIQTLGTPPRDVMRAPSARHYRDQDRPGLHFFAPGEPSFVNPDAIAIASAGKVGILRLPPGDAPPTVDNPAWLLSADAAPVELAPWSTLELATSPGCAGSHGYRALVQTGTSWLDVVGAAETRMPGMTALVRWSPERVCLEAVEVGFSSLEAQPYPIRVSAVARFVGRQPGAAFIGTESSVAVREPSTCQLEGP
jgi:hypothetical protein